LCLQRVYESIGIDRFPKRKGKPGLRSPKNCRKSAGSKVSLDVPKILHLHCQLTWLLALGLFKQLLENQVVQPHGSKGVV